MREGSWAGGPGVVSHIIPEFPTSVNDLRCLEKNEQTGHKIATRQHYISFPEIRLIVKHNIMNRTCNNSSPLTAWGMSTPLPEHINIERTNNTSIGNPPVTTTRVTRGMTPLPADFTPTDYSVILGRGKGSYNHVGNKRCRVIVRSYLEQYNNFNTRFEKATVVTKVLKAIKQACPEGAFIKKANGIWYEVDEKTAREKCFTMFRDCQNSHSKGTTTTKPAAVCKQTQQKTADKTYNGENDEMADHALMDDFLAFAFSDEESATSVCGSFYDIDSCSLCTI